MIEGIEELRPELHAPTIVDRDALEDSHIPVKQTRSDYRSLAHIALNAGRSKSERAGIEVIHARGTVTGAASNRLADDHTAVFVQSRLGNVLARENGKG